MDSNVIRQNEQNNNRLTIHLYFNKEMHSWISSGYSVTYAKHEVFV